MSEPATTYISTYLSCTVLYVLFLSSGVVWEFKVLLSGPPLATKLLSCPPSSSLPLPFSRLLALLSSPLFSEEERERRGGIKSGRGGRQGKRRINFHGRFLSLSLSLSLTVTPRRNERVARRKKNCGKKVEVLLLPLTLLR